MVKEKETIFEKEMNVTDHLAELRKRLIVTALFFILFFILGFIFVKHIYHFFEDDIPFDLHITGITDTLKIYITMASIVAITGTLPILSFQIWSFIKPGLTPQERKASLSYIPGILFLFIGGLTFGYLVFVHFIMPFLISLNDGMFEEIFTVDKYFKFIFRITIPIAFLFETPIITMFLTSLGILTPRFLRKNRKYAYFILLILGAFITPPDVFLQLIVAIPLFLIYEISIYLSNITYRKKLRKHQAFMKNDSSNS